MPKRSVILHFHLFKNAGTSVDEILQYNFGDQWTEIEGTKNKKLTTERLVEFIQKNPEYNAISSHTAVINVPEIDNINILPIIFLRHPIDRIRSVYEFERQQDAQTPGAIKAKEGNFCYYMDWRLSTANRHQVYNFHANRLKDFDKFTPVKQTELVEKRARQALDKLPFTGLVEKFDASMKKFASLIQLHFPDFETFPVRANSHSIAGVKLSQRLNNFKTEIGQETYETLVAFNRLDIELYFKVKSQEFFSD